MLRSRLLNRSAVAVLAMLFSLNLTAGPRLKLAGKTQGSLPEALVESSGLAKSAGLIWSHNDSGSEPVLYAVNTSGELVKQIDVGSSVNTDWEDLASDDEFLYIADTGNNIGFRRQLSLYRLPINALTSANNRASLDAEHISYSYADRPWSLPGRDHNYDAEALALVDGKPWLFSKNRADWQTQLYTLTWQKDQQVAPVASYPVGGLITAADYHSGSKRMALMGYRPGAGRANVFIWLVDVVGDRLDWSSAKQFWLNKPGQWEALAWRDANSLWLTTEGERGKGVLATVKLPKNS